MNEIYSKMSAKPNNIEMKMKKKLICDIFDDPRWFESKQVCKIELEDLMFTFMFMV